MGMFDSIAGRVKSDAEWRAGSEISSGIGKGIGAGIGGITNRKKEEKCPKCNKPLPQSGLKFCPSCGAKLFVSCGKCNKEFPIGTKFCTQCGGALQ